MTNRQAERKILSDAKVAEIEKYYSPLIKAAEEKNDMEEVSRLKKEAQGKYDESMKTFDDETNAGLNAIAKTLLDKLNSYAHEINKHEGPDGVIKEASKRMTGKSKDIQDGKVKVKWEGKEVTNSK